jgi:hypothetical protein
MTDVSNVGCQGTNVTTNSDDTSDLRRDLSLGLALAALGGLDRRTRLGSDVDVEDDRLDERRSDRERRLARRVARDLL